MQFQVLRLLVSVSGESLGPQSRLGSTPPQKPYYDVGICCLISPNSRPGCLRYNRQSKLKQNLN